MHLYLLSNNILNFLIFVFAFSWNWDEKCMNIRSIYRFQELKISVNIKTSKILGIALHFFGTHLNVGANTKMNSVQYNFNFVMQHWILYKFSKFWILRPPFLRQTRILHWNRYQKWIPCLEKTLVIASLNYQLIFDLLELLTNPLYIGEISLTNLVRFLYYNIPWISYFYNLQTWCYTIFAFVESLPSVVMISSITRTGLLSL